VKYRMAGPANMIDGRPVFRAVGTQINWQAIGVDPTVMVQNSARIQRRFPPARRAPMEAGSSTAASISSVAAIWPTSSW